MDGLTFGSRVTGDEARGTEKKETQGTGGFQSTELRVRGPDTEGESDLGVIQGA